MPVKVSAPRLRDATHQCWLLGCPKLAAGWRLSQASPLPALTQGSGGFVMLLPSRGEARQEVTRDSPQLSREQGFTFTALWPDEALAPHPRCELAGNHPWQLDARAGAQLGPLVTAAMPGCHSRAWSLSCR